MKKNFITNLVLLILLNILIKPIWFFGIEVNVQNRVGNEQYGLYFSLLGFSLLFNMLLDFGITNFNNREISRHNHLVSKYFNSIVVVKLFLGILYFLVMLTGAFILGYNGSQLLLLLVLALNQFLASFLLYLRSNINGMMMFRTDSLLSVADKFLMIIVCAFLLWGIPNSNFKIEWFVYAQSLSYLIPVVLAWIVIRKKIVFVLPRFNIRYFYIIARQSYLYAFMVLLMFLYNRSDVVILERLLPDGAAQVGIYAQSFRIVDFASNYAFLFATLLLPVFSRMLKNKEDVSDIIDVSVRMLLIPSVILTIIGFFFGTDLLDLLYNGNHEGVLILNLLLVGFLGISTNYIFSTLLTSNGNIKTLVIISAIFFIMNIILNLLLIPRFQALGAAISFCITQLVSASVQFLLAKRLISFDFSMKLIIKILLIVLILIFTGISINQADLDLEKNLGIFGLVLIMVIVFSKVYPIRKIMEFIQGTISQKS